MSKALKEALKNELRAREEDPAGTTNFAHAPVNGRFITPLDMSSHQPGYMRGTWRKITPRKWNSPSGVTLTVNAERLTAGNPEHQFVYFNSGDTVQVRDY